MADLDSRLQVIFISVCDWVKFAEAKNAGLVALNGAGVGAMLSFLGAASSVPRPWLVGVMCGVLCFAGSVSVGLLSFLPRTNLPRLLQSRRGEPSDSDNLFFFGDIKKYSGESLIDAYARLYWVDLGLTSTRPLIDLADQITVNSRIASDKFRLFSLGARLSLLGVALIFLIPGFNIVSSHLGQC